MSNLLKRTRFTALDLVLIVLIAAFLSFVAYRIVYTLDYDWSWSALVSYMIRFDDDSTRYVPGILMLGLFTTLKLSFWAGITAIVLGLVMGLCRISRNYVLKNFSGLYVHFVRNIPSIVFIFIFYFFFSSQVIAYFDFDNKMAAFPDSARGILEFCFSSPGNLSVFLSGMFTLAIYEGAYMTEIVRAGIESVEKGQWEAADSLGFTKYGKMRYIVLPQAVRRILPAVSGQLISVVKDSAIVSVISVQELTFRGMELMASTYRTFEIWTAITLMYFVITFTCSFLLRKLNMKMQLPLGG